MRSACPPIMYGCRYLNFSRSKSEMELLTRKTIQRLEGEIGLAHLDEYADRTTERGQCLLKSICEEMGFDSLEFQTLDGMLEAIGLDREKVCTYSFLLSLGFDETFCSHVRSCISTHRFRKEARPATIEAEILFDADKLDAAGALGIARTLLYQGTVQAPLYALSDDGSVSDGRADAKETFFGEYHYKLEKLYGQFLTSRGSALAQHRQQAARDFCDSLLSEVRYPYEHGPLHLQKYLDLP